MTVVRYYLSLTLGVDTKVKFQGGRYESFKISSTKEKHKTIRTI